MSSHASDLPTNPAVAEIEPVGEATAEAFHAFVERLLAGPEPELEEIGAAEALRGLRADAQG